MIHIEKILASSLHQAVTSETLLDLHLIWHLEPFIYFRQSRVALKALLKQFWSEKLGGNSACCSDGALKRRLCISSDASLVRDKFFQHGVNKYSHSSQ